MHTNIYFTGASLVVQVCPCVDRGYLCYDERSTLHPMRHNCTSVTYLATTLSFVNLLPEHGHCRLQNVPVPYSYETTAFYCCAIVGISIMNHPLLLEMFQSNNRYWYTA